MSEDDNSIKPAAFAGLKDFEFLFNKASSTNIEWLMSYTFKALKSGKTKVVNDIIKHQGLDKWKDYFLEAGLNSMAIVPLKTKGNPIGAYFLYSNELNFFNKSEIKLLEEMADDISFAIESIEKDAKRKEAEKALSESETKLRSIYNNAAVGIDLLDRDFKFIQLNDRLSKMFGYKNNELVGKSILDVTFSDDFEITIKNLTGLVNGNSESYILEKRYMKKDGTIFWGEVSASAIRKEEGEFLAIIGVIVDITQRKMAEEKIIESEEKYRELVENANSIIAKFDKEGKILSINEFGLKLFGYKEEELLGKTWVETILPKVDTTGKILESLATDIVNDVDKYSVNLNENIKKNGERVWIYWTNKPIRNENGDIEGILSVGTDVTDKIIADKQMEQNVEYFAHLVDHIRNPLAILSGFVQVKVDDEETRDRVLRQVDRIEDIIKQLDRGWMDTEDTRKFLKKHR
ncbi:MAG: Bacterioopsin transcriptional activator [Candidatus Methanofastidiosum methylothiophilum]|uniref:Bacterioopsin transcriptional activator n=1 Tax=Candidatus Methanofastidiosum methylothiophilum TaxID=1705564 RepID=A0A150J3X3_9EURY|nr:MAG: Bacterioopsin transcriptional activator [Candidatus Methanofastidiosum methylthiophilus]